MINFLLNSREILPCRKGTQSDKVSDVKTLDYKRIYESSIIYIFKTLDYKHLHVYLKCLSVVTLEEGHVFSNL